jgi:hypothetical protein
MWRRYERLISRRRRRAIRPPGDAVIVPWVCFNRGTPSFFHELRDHSGSLGSCTLFGIDVRRGNPYGRGNNPGRGDRGRP